MGLDTKYIPIGALQDYFVDKDTAFPLAAGTVYFYKDQARTVPKPVYQISGAPPNYVYTTLGTSLTLSSVGTFVDGGGSDIIPYYYPYDDLGNIELYYVTVYSSGNIFQFSREGQPNVSASTEGSVSLLNYIPNGQFLEHIDYPDDGSIPVSGTDYALPVAYGNWFFSSTANSTSVNNITFERIGTATDNPTASPRYWLHAVCTVSDATDLYKKIEVRFPDVNKFSSDTQEYTLFFTAKSNTGSFYNVDFVVRKFFGVGGGPDVSTDIKTVTITNNSKSFSIPFVFGANQSYVIGNNDDDYVSLEIHFQTNFVFDLEFTDFVLTPGDIIVSEFPQTPQAQFTYEGIFGSLPVPAADGSDLYLPLILTRYGVSYDTGIIGKIFSAMYDSAKPGEVLCDGSSLKVADYSIEGIPYKRYFDAMYNPTFGGCKFGTGKHFVTAFRGFGINSTPYILLWTNTAGLVNGATDGAIPTGFTFTQSFPGIAPSFNAYYGDFDGFVYAKCIARGITTAASAGTTSFSVITVRPGTASTNAIYGFGNINDSTYTAGSYILLSDTTNNYYVWFTKDGVGSDPAVPGRTGSRIDMVTGIDATVPNYLLARGISGQNSNVVRAIAASSITPGSYFTFRNYLNEINYVWFTVDGVGTDPAVVNAQGIKCALLGADTDIAVGQKSTVAINSVYAGVPDLRGMFLRGVSGTSGIDPAADYRSDRGDGQGGNIVGSIEDYTVQNHQHLSVIDISPAHDEYGTSYSTAYSGGGGGGWGNTSNIAQASHTSFEGGDETRPVNTNVNYFIKI